MSQTTRAIRMDKTGDTGVLKMVEIPLPPPGPGEVQVRIEATGVAYADIVMRQGVYPGVKAPVVPGYDFVGRIEAVGPGVTGWNPGDRVAALTVTGSYAERRNVSAEWLAQVPDSIDAGKAVACVLNGLTAWQMLHRVAQPLAGEAVLVHGAGGGVGGLLLDFARLAGVTAIGSASASKKAAVEAKGGLHIDYKSEDLAARAIALSDGGVVAAYDHIGGKHLKSVSIKALRPGGTAVIYGGYDVTKGGKLRIGAALDAYVGGMLSAMSLFSASQGVVGYNVTSWRDARRAAYREDLAAIFALLAEEKFDPLVGARFDLSEAAQAQTALETAKVAGKIVLAP